MEFCVCSYNACIHLKDLGSARKNLEMSVFMGERAAYFIYFLVFLSVVDQSEATIIDESLAFRITIW